MIVKQVSRDLKHFLQLYRDRAGEKKDDQRKLPLKVTLAILIRKALNQS